MLSVEGAAWVKAAEEGERREALPPWRAAVLATSGMTPERAQVPGWELGRPPPGQFPAEVLKLSQQARRAELGSRGTLAGAAGAGPGRDGPMGAGPDRVSGRSREAWATVCLRKASPGGACEVSGCPAKAPRQVWFVLPVKGGVWRGSGHRTLGFCLPRSREPLPPRVALCWCRGGGPRARPPAEQAPSTSLEDLPSLPGLSRQGEPLPKASQLGGDLRSAALLKAAFVPAGMRWQLCRPGWPGAPGARCPAAHVAALLAQPGRDSESRSLLQVRFLGRDAVAPERRELF